MFIFYIKKSLTSVSKLMSPWIKSSFISIFSLNTDSFQNLHVQYIDTDYGLKTHQSVIKKTLLSPCFSTDFSVFEHYFLISWYLYNNNCRKHYAFYSGPPPLGISRQNNISAPWNLTKQHSPLGILKSFKLINPWQVKCLLPGVRVK